MAQVLFFGGSGVFGIGDAEGGWADRFRRDWHGRMYGNNAAGTSHELFNLGVPGNTASDIFARLQAELPSRMVAERPTLVVLQAGTNDSRADQAPTNYVSNRDEFMANLVNCIELVKSYTPNILLVGLTPIDDLRTRPTADSSYFTQARVHEFDTAMTEVAGETHVEKIELYQSMLTLDWRAMLYADGLHLNNVGHEWVYLRVREPLEKLIATMGVN